MRALLIDDQAFILAAFQTELLALDSRVALVSVESARGARQAMAGADPFDFVLLDLQLAGENSFDLLAELCHSFPATPIIAVSGLAADADVVRAVYLGAVAFVPRHAGGEALVAALRTVASGHIYVPPMIFGAGRCPAPAVAFAGQPAVDARIDRHGEGGRDSAWFSSSAAHAAPDRCPDLDAARPVEQADRHVRSTSPSKPSRTMSRPCCAR